MGLSILGRATISRISVAQWSILCGAVLVVVSTAVQALPIGYLFDKDQIEEVNRHIRNKVEIDTKTENHVRKQLTSREARLSGKSDLPPANDSDLTPSKNAERRPAPKSK